MKSVYFSVPCVANLEPVEWMFLDECSWVKRRGTSLHFQVSIFRHSSRFSMSVEHLLGPSVRVRRGFRRGIQPALSELWSPCSYGISACMVRGAGVLFLRENSTDMAEKILILMFSSCKLFSSFGRDILHREEPFGCLSFWPSVSRPRWPANNISAPC